MVQLQRIKDIKAWWTNERRPRVEAHHWEAYLWNNDVMELDLIK